MPSTDASNRHEDDDHEEDGGQQSWSEFACGTFVRAERFSLTTADCCRRCGGALCKFSGRSSRPVVLYPALGERCGVRPRRVRVRSSGLPQTVRLGC